jgi:hypothetical protein
MLLVSPLSTSRKPHTVVIPIRTHWLVVFDYLLSAFIKLASMLRDGATGIRPQMPLSSLHQVATSTSCC